jgi:hypothetical protein
MLIQPIEKPGISENAGLLFLCPIRFHNSMVQGHESSSAPWIWVSRFVSNLRSWHSLTETVTLSGQPFQHDHLIPIQQHEDVRHCCRRRGMVFGDGVEKSMDSVFDR